MKIDRNSVTPWTTNRGFGHQRSVLRCTGEHLVAEKSSRFIAPREVLQKQCTRGVEQSWGSSAS